MTGPSRQPRRPPWLGGAARALLHDAPRTPREPVSVLTCSEPSVPWCPSSLAGRPGGRVAAEAGGLVASHKVCHLPRSPPSSRVARSPSDSSARRAIALAHRAGRQTEDGERVGCDLGRIAGMYQNPGFGFPRLRCLRRGAGACRAGPADAEAREVIGASRRPAKLAMRAGNCRGARPVRRGVRARRRRERIEGRTAHSPNNTRRVGSMKRPSGRSSRDPFGFVWVHPL